MDDYSFLDECSLASRALPHAYRASLLLKAYERGLVMHDYYGRSLLDLDPIMIY